MYSRILVLSNLQKRLFKCQPNRLTSFYRFNSTSSEFSEKEVEKAKHWLQTFTVDKIPISVFEITYSRASGAGGQKVNKTSSKATVSLTPDQWLNSQFCYWIPGPIRYQLSSKKLRYETKSGGLILQSDLTRNRDVNTEDCFKKLLHEIKALSYFPSEISEDDKKKWEEIKEDRREKRLFNKKKQSDKKKGRSKKFDL